MSRTSVACNIPRKPALERICLLAGLLFLQGCGTLSSSMARAPEGDHYDGPIIYGGVCYSVGTAIPSYFREGKVDLGLLYTIDLPISFCLDTILLPFTIWAQFHSDDESTTSL